MTFLDLLTPISQTPLCTRDMPSGGRPRWGGGVRGEIAAPSLNLPTQHPLLSPPPPLPQFPLTFLPPYFFLYPISLTFPPAFLSHRFYASVSSYFVFSFPLFSSTSSPIPSPTLFPYPLSSPFLPASLSPSEGMGTGGGDHNPISQTPSFYHFSPHSLSPSPIRGIGIGGGGGHSPILLIHLHPHTPLQHTITPPTFTPPPPASPVSSSPCHVNTQNQLSCDLTYSAVSELKRFMI